MNIELEAGDLIYIKRRTHVYGLTPQHSGQILIGLVVEYAWVDSHENFFYKVLPCNANEEGMVEIGEFDMEIMSLRGMQTRSAKRRLSEFICS